MSLQHMLKPRLVELGAVRIGTLGDERQSAKGTTYRLPQKLDHFLVTTNMRDDHDRLKNDDALLKQLQDDYGDADGKLRRIPIVLLSDRLEDNLRCAWVYYAGKVCLARSDGEQLWKYGDLKTGKLFDEPQVQKWSDKFLEAELHGKPIFKKHTSLEFMIDSPRARWGGVYRFRTTSEITGDQLYGSLLHLKRLTQGVLCGIQFMLVVRPVVVTPDGKPTIVYVCHVEWCGAHLMDLQAKSLEIARFHRAHRLEIIEIQRELGSHPDPGEGESDAEQAEIQQHFHPEGGGGSTEPPTMRDTVSGLKKAAGGSAEHTNSWTPSAPLNTGDVVNDGGVSRTVGETGQSSPSGQTEQPDNTPVGETNQTSHALNGRGGSTEPPPAATSEKPLAGNASETVHAAPQIELSPLVRDILDNIPKIRTEQGLQMRLNKYEAFKDKDDNAAAEPLVMAAIEKRRAELAGKT